MKEPIPNLIDHTIQKGIVKTLTTKGSVRYSDLKPKNLESNIFMYHLNLLKKRGVVEKVDSNYSLSTVGRIFVDRANLEKLKFRVQPKIVTILAIKTKNHRWLILERLHEPHMNRIGFPSGKLHYGEDLKEAATRELMEKAGIDGVDLTLAGNVLMKFINQEDGEVINHTIGYVFTSEVDEEIETKNISQFWTSYWGDEADLSGENIFRGHKDILALISKGKLFIESLEFDSDY